MKFHDDMEKAFNPFKMHTGEEFDYVVDQYMYMYHEDDQYYYKHFGDRSYLVLDEQGKKIGGHLNDWKDWA